MDTVVYYFDDSPVKLPAAGLLAQDGISTEVREVSHLVTKMQLGQPFKEGTVLVASKAHGFGSKPLKSWVKKLELEFDGKPSGMEDAMFWQEYFAYWKGFKGFNPKLLAVSDVLKTLQMRLTSFYDDRCFMETIGTNFVSFGPFEGGLTTLSYQNILWYRTKLQGDEWSTWAKQWCDWAMAFAEKKYINELIAMGYKLPSDQVDGAAENLRQDADQVDGAAEKLRQDAVLYFTRLKASSQRNNVAHVFSSAIEQRVYTTETMGNKNRALCNFLKTVVDSETKGNLLAMVENLSDLSKIPGGLGALTLALPMQLFFLKQLITRSMTPTGPPTF